MPTAVTRPAMRPTFTPEPCEFPSEFPFEEVEGEPPESAEPVEMVAAPEDWPPSSVAVAEAMASSVVGEDPH